MTPTLPSLRKLRLSQVNDAATHWLWCSTDSNTLFNVIKWSGVLGSGNTALITLYLIVLLPGVLQLSMPIKYCTLSHRPELLQFLSFFHYKPEICLYTYPFFPPFLSFQSPPSTNAFDLFIPCLLQDHAFSLVSSISLSLLLIFVNLIHFCIHSFR